MSKHSILRVSRRVVLSLALVVSALSVPTKAFAGSLVFIPPDPDIEDLDHHYVYTWVIKNITSLLPNGTNSITGASLTFNNISNWTEAANRLYLALLSEASTTSSTSVANNTTTLLKIAGGTTGGNTNVASAIYRMQDDANLSNNNVSFRDDLAKDTTGSSMSSLYTSAGQKMIPSTTTGVTPLGNQFGTGYYSSSLSAMQEGWVQGALGDGNESFDDTPETFVLNFTSAQLANLKAYIAADGEIAIGLDPDCHFNNSSIVFTIYTEDGTPGGQNAVPEPATLTLFGTGLAALAWSRRRRSAAARS